MNNSWDVSARKLEVSADGFRNDVRPIAAPFKETGTQKWGGNLNTLFEAPVRQQVKQLRLTSPLPARIRPSTSPRSRSWARAPVCCRRSAR